MPLPDRLSAEIDGLCLRGDTAAEAGRLDEAKALYVEALRLLPDDPSDSATTTAQPTS